MGLADATLRDCCVSADQTMKPVKFKSTLVNPKDHFGWHFVKVPPKIGSKFEKKDGTRRSVCTINGVEPFQCALLPSSEGDFLIVAIEEDSDPAFAESVEPDHRHLGRLGTIAIGLKV